MHFVCYFFCTKGAFGAADISQKKVCLYACCLYGIILLQCRAFAKALHYKEMEFEGALSKRMDANLVAVVEALIHINS